MNARMQTHIHTHTHAHTHTCRHAHMQTCTHMHVCANTHTHTVHQIIKLERKKVGWERSHSQSHLTLAAAMTICALQTVIITILYNMERDLFPLSNTSVSRKFLSYTAYRMTLASIRRHSFLQRLSFEDHKMLQAHLPDKLINAEYQNCKVVLGAAVSP